LERTGTRDKLARKWASARRLTLYAWNRFVRGLALDGPPVFIVACGHSGTSLLLAILGAHPRLFAVPYESNAAIGENRRRFDKRVRKFERMAIAAGKRRWIEKTPKHILHIGTIKSWCPDAKFILMIRDGRDVAWSIRKRTGSLEEGVQRWIDDNLAGREHWNDPDVHVLRYEDLVADFESTTRSALRFLGEEYDERLREYHRTPKRWYSKDISKPPTAEGDRHRQHRNWQINQPLFDGRGRHAEMSDEERAFVVRRAGALLAELGYVAREELHERGQDRG
jgi:hypothetical protein